MKNLLKSIFVSSFPLFALIILFRSVTNDLFHLNIAGLFIASISIVLFFSLLFIKPVARTSRTLSLYSIPILLGFIFNLIQINYPIIYISSFLLLGWLIYLFWYSVFENREKNMLELGTKITDLDFQNILNKTVTLSDFTGDYKILLFYRGNWCPLCMAQIKEIVNEYKELEKRNADVLLISSQPHSFTKSLAKKHHVPFHFLVDLKNKVAKKLKIIHENGLPFGFQLFGYESDVVMPTLIITDKNNKIIFADLTDNYRVRPEPSTFLKIIDDNNQ